MSEHITHTAVFDDCARLALHSGTICDGFKISLSEHREVGRLGSVSRHRGHSYDHSSMS